MEIFDPLRKKYVALTPEEAVRQTTISLLRDRCLCPASLMMSEYSFKFNRLNYRADIVVFDRMLRPVMLVECKAPTVKLTDEVVDQALRYNRVLDVPFIMITNGEAVFLFKRVGDTGVYSSAEHVPTYEEMIK